MKLSAKSRYAVMAVVDMCYYFNNKPTSLQYVAERQNIALNYLEQIFVKLRKGGIVRSVKGPGGGYILNKELHEIKLADILEAIDGSVQMTRCKPKNGGCVDKSSKCLTHNVWKGLEKTIVNYLNSISLNDILSNLPTKAPVTSAIHCEDVLV